MYQMMTLGHGEAQKAIAAIVAELQKSGKSAAMAVADVSGELVGLLRMDGTAAQCAGIAINKAFTAARERKPSREVGQGARDAVTGFDIAYLGDKRFVGWGGGLPVVADGNTVGAVAVSGLSEDEDVRLARIGVAAILGGPERG